MAKIRPTSSLDVAYYSSHQILFLCKTIQELGFSEQQLLSGSGLEPRQLEQEKTRISGQQILHIMQNAIKLAPHAAFASGKFYQISTCGIVGFAMSSSPSRSHIIAIIERYHHLIDPLFRLEHSFVGDLSTWTLHENFPCAISNPLYQFILEMKLVCFKRVLGQLYGNDVEFERIHIRYPRPQNYLNYYEQFTDNVQFDCPVNQIFLKQRKDLDERESADLITQQQILALCEQESERYQQQISMGGQVLNLLNQATEGAPTLEQVARQLKQNPRTLRRRLEAEGTSYSDLLQQYRIAFASDHLSNRTLSIQQIACLLGYSDTSNFRRAFTSWTGKTPSQFRSEATNHKKPQV